MTNLCYSAPGVATVAGSGLSAGACAATSAETSPVARLAETSHLRRRHRHVRRQGYFLRIHVHATTQVLVMQVRTGRESRHTDVTDDFALRDTVAGAETAGKTRQVSVHGSDLIDVLEFHDLAVAAFVADEAHSTATGCSNGCADRSGVVDAAVSPDPIEDRVTTIKIEA